MALFKKKSPEYVDLGEKIRKKEERISNFKQNNSTVDNEISTPQEKNTQSSDSSGFFGFFGGSNNASEVQPTVEAEAKKIKISEKLREITHRIEEQENEIFKLKKKIEILERKQKLNY